MSAGSEMSAAGILFAHNGPEGWEVCLAKRSEPPDLGKWYLPGGGVEAGETPWQAAERETREEWCADRPVAEFFAAFTLGDHLEAQAIPHVYHSGGWSFTTFLLPVRDRFPVEMLHLNHEFFPASARWISARELDALYDQDLLRYNLIRAARSFGLI